jgi:hypothetical protein
MNKIAVKLIALLFTLAGLALPSRSRLGNRILESK